MRIEPEFRKALPSICIKDRNKKKYRKIKSVISDFKFFLKIFTENPIFFRPANLSECFILFYSYDFKILSWFCSRYTSRRSYAIDLVSWSVRAALTAEQLHAHSVLQSSLPFREISTYPRILAGKNSFYTYRKNFINIHISIGAFSIKTTLTNGITQTPVV